MPSTIKQRRVAGRELRLRREGKVKQEANRATATRMMGSMSTTNLRKYAQSIDKEIVKLERNNTQSPTAENAMRLRRAKAQKIREDNV